jgi:acetyl esterase/lipase
VAVASWLFLAMACVVAFFSLNAFIPVRRNRILFLPSFFASWLTIELAWWHLIWEFVVAAVFVRFGALESPIGWLALAILVVNWIALVVILVAARRSSQLAAKALADLGGDDEEPPRSRIAKDKNLTYTRAGGRDIKLDVIRPATPPAPGERRPAILQIHGGAWIIGDKREQGLPLLKYLAARGWVAFNANYRLSPGATWPDHLLDLKQAVRWIREHADEYGIDPGFVAVTGGSAGGHLTAMMALTGNEPEYQPGFEDVDTSVQAAVPFYGIYDFTNRLDTAPAEMREWILEPIVLKRFFADDPEAFHEASPMDLVRPDAPPFLVIHGASDTLAPVDDAREFARLLGDASDSPVLYLELPGAQHAFDVFTSIRTRRVVRAVHRFLTVVHARHLEGRHPAEPAVGEPEMPAAAVEVDEPADVRTATIEAAAERAAS